MIFLGAKKLGLRSLAAALAFLMVLGNTPLPAPAQDFQDSDDNDDIEQTVARISYISGQVSYGRGDDPDDWDPAITNLPFTLGDRIYSSPDGRAELQLPGGNFVRIGRGSYLTALTLTYDTKQFYLGSGTVTVHIRRIDPDEIFEIDTPSVAVTFDTPGRYRVEVDDDGDTRVIVRRGTAIVAADGREVTVEQAEMRITGMDSPRYEIVGLRAADAFDRWVDEREGRFERANRGADRYANERIVGLEDLAEHGRWEEIPEYGYAWTPTRVAVGWQPFTVGHWYWQDPWGWTWISEEPWGWAPSHYGRWTYHRSRWYWVPVERRVRVVRYVPAVVEFVYVRNHVGWFPLHPRDRFVPWWSRRARVEEVAYVNRTRVVVIDEETFVSSRRVTTRIVRDTTIIREVTTIRVRERSMPIPRRESLRAAFEEGQRRPVQRPSEKILLRPAVVRTAPSPPPPRFEEKLRVIRERQGKPLAPEEILNLGAKEFKANQRARIRPAAEGRGGFAPAKESPSTPPPRSVTPSKGRKLATRDEPVLTNLPPRRERQPEKQQEKQVQEQERKDQKRDEQKAQKEEKDRQRDKQEQERQKKLPDQDRQKQQKGIPEQQRKDQQEREKQEQERKQKLEDQQRQKQEKQLQQRQQKEQQQRDAEQRREQERKRQQEERERQKQLQEQQKKDQQLRQQQQREEQQLREQDRQKQQELERQQRLQEQERQKQLKEQQRQQQQSQKEQQRQEQERLRLERQQQQQEEQTRQKQLQEQRRLQKQREEQKRLQEKGGETPAPTGPTTPPPPPPR
jgi:hypothetical protein